VTGDPVAALRVPQAAPEQFAPERDQFTVVSTRPATTPANDFVLLTSTVALSGVMVMVTTFRVNVVVWLTGTPAASTALMVIVSGPGVAAPVVDIVRVDVPGPVKGVGLKEQLTPAGGATQEGVREPA